MTSGSGASAPKYQRIADELRRQIRAGQPPPGQRMPTETDLVDRFRVSLPTVRQALGVLRSEGLIESRHGIGTFVKESRRLQRRSRHRYGRARQDKQLLTSHLQHRIVSVGREPTPEHVAAIVGEDAPEFVVRRRVLYHPDTGQPEEVGASFLPIKIAANTFLEQPTVVPKALFLCVEDLAGKTYAHARDQWVARLPSADEAATLELAAGSPVIHLIHTAEADDGAVLEVSESVWPAERVVILDDYPITAYAAETDAPSEV